MSKFNPLVVLFVLLVLSIGVFDLAAFHVKVYLLHGEPVVRWWFDATFERVAVLVSIHGILALIGAGVAWEVYTDREYAKVAHVRENAWRVTREDLVGTKR